MKRNFSISSFLLSLFLSAAMLLPTLVQFGHIFEEHQHVACDEVKTHLHEVSVDCSLCDFHFSSFDYDAVVVLDFTLILPIFSSENNTHDSEIKTVKTANYLRGPPIFS